MFPKGKEDEGLALSSQIREKGYEVLYQFANTLGYTDKELLSLIEKVNRVKPVSVSIVDTFGAMYVEDLERITALIEHNLDSSIAIGFHSHNNLQLSFALAIKFIEILERIDRTIIVDSSLCGMGRGAGNANTELVANYINKKHRGNYNMNAIMDAIDMYMPQFLKKYSWGFSTSYFISGNYCAHVNNIAYLKNNHQTNSRVMNNIIEMLDPEMRLGYDYDNLEAVYTKYCDLDIDDTKVIANLKKVIAGKEVLLLVPGKSILTEQKKIEKFMSENKPIVIGVNAVFSSYSCDFVFFSNIMRYEYAKDAKTEVFDSLKKILTSNLKVDEEKNNYQININNIVKREWKYYDNSAVMCIRLMEIIDAAKVTVAGLDGFSVQNGYYDQALETNADIQELEKKNEDLKEMLHQLLISTQNSMPVKFLTSMEIL